MDCHKNGAMVSTLSPTVQTLLDRILADPQGSNNYKKAINKQVEYKEVCRQGEKFVTNIEINIHNIMVEEGITLETLATKLNITPRKLKNMLNNSKLTVKMLGQIQYILSQYQLEFQSQTQEEK